LHVGSRDDQSRSLRLRRWIISCSDTAREQQLCATSGHFADSRERLNLPKGRFPFAQSSMVMRTPATEVLAVAFF
jgi:hypothetical protein